MSSLPNRAGQMRIGYLHIGPRDHGVYRCGLILAAEAGKRASLSVVEATVTLTGNWREDRAKIIVAARRLAGTDLVHLHYNSQRDGSIWGRGWRQLYHLRLFARICRTPFVVQVHDFYPRDSPATLLKHAVQQLTGMAKTTVGQPVPDSSSPPRLHPSAFVKQIKSTFGPVGSTVRWLARRSRLMIVGSEEEHRRLAAFVKRARTRVIFLVAEERTVSVSPAEAKSLLGLSGLKVVTLLGFIHPRKGHKLLLQALSTLPTDYVVVFAGKAREKRIEQDLLAFARDHGVEQRMRLTGYLPEEELERYLAATDLAVCPFETAAASSSINTWISAARPILASDLPLVSEYNRLAPGAIRTFAPHTADALSHAIQDMLATPDDSLSGVHCLRETLAASKNFDEHLDAYRQALESELQSRFTAQAVPTSIDT